MKKLLIAVMVGVLCLPLVGTNAQPALDKELFVYNWGDYIDEEIVRAYETEFGVRVVYDTYASNEELFAKIQAGAEYDIIVPSDYMVARLIELGLLAKIDKANVPNAANLDPEAVNVWYDPGAEYCLPYMLGLTALAYSADLERVPDSWGAIFDPEQAKYYADAGGINVLDDQRELIGAALKYLGYSANETDPAKLAQARDTILKALPFYRYINSADYQDTLLPSKEVVLSHSWSGGTAKVAIATNGEWKQAIPKEGGLRTQESMCITAKSPRKTTAEHFINYIYDAKRAATISNTIGYLSANKAAREFINPELLNFLPPNDVLKTFEFIRPLPEDARKLWDQTWTEIRAAAGQ